MEAEEDPRKPPIQPNPVPKTPTLPVDRPIMRKNGIYRIRSPLPTVFAEGPAAKKPRLELPLVIDRSMVVRNGQQVIPKPQQFAPRRPPYRCIKVEPVPTEDGNSTLKRKTYSCRYVTVPTASVKNDAQSSSSEENGAAHFPSGSCSPNEILKAMATASTSKELPKIPLVPNYTARVVKIKNPTPISAPPPVKKNIPPPSHKGPLPRCSYSPNGNLKGVALQNASFSKDPFKIPVIPAPTVRFVEINKPTPLPALPVKRNVPSPSQKYLHPSCSHSPNQNLKSTALQDTSVSKEPFKLPVIPTAAVRFVETKNLTAATPEKKASPPSRIDLRPSYAYLQNQISRTIALQNAVTPTARFVETQNSIALPAATEKKIVLPSSSKEQKTDFIPSWSYSPDEIWKSMTQEDVSFLKESGLIPGGPTTAVRFLETKKSTPLPATHVRNNVLPPSQKDLPPLCSYSPNELSRAMGLQNASLSKQPANIPVVSPSGVRVVEIKKFPIPQPVAPETKKKNLPPTVQKMADFIPYASFTPNEMLKSIVDYAFSPRKPRENPTSASSSSSSAGLVVENKNSTPLPLPLEKKTAPTPSPNEKPDLIPSSSKSPIETFTPPTSPSNKNPSIPQVDGNGNREAVHFLRRGVQVDVNSPHYAKCNICIRFISNTRKSNLLSHARRHCASKRYTCNLCLFQTCENSRILRHMLQNHVESPTSFEDHTEALQETWDALMRECFPDYLDPKSSEEVAGSSDEKAKKSSGTRENSRNGRNKLDLESLQLESLHACAHCGEAVIVEGKILAPLISHLTSKHQELCFLYKCAICDYANPDEKVVWWHVNSRHDPDANGKVQLLPAYVSNLVKLVPKFFPSAENVFGNLEDDDEIAYKAQPDRLRSLWSKPSETQLSKNAPEDLVKEEEKDD